MCAKYNFFMHMHLQSMGLISSEQKPKCSLDTVNNCKFLKEVYLKADPGRLQ